MDFTELNVQFVYFDAIFWRLVYQHCTLCGYSHAREMFWGRLSFSDPQNTPPAIMMCKKSVFQTTKFDEGITRAGCCAALFFDKEEPNEGRFKNNNNNLSWLKTTTTITFVSSHFVESFDFIHNNAVPVPSIIITTIRRSSLPHIRNDNETRRSPYY